MVDYINRLAEDIAFGVESEKDNYEIIKEFVCCPELQRNKRNDIFDFESENILVELKTRKCLSNKYKDSMVGVNKLNYAKQKGKETYFFFSFEDGLFYWKYNLEEESKLRFGRGGRFDRGRVEQNNYFFIPIDLLKKI